MKIQTVALGAIALAFAGAEAVAPTHWHYKVWSYAAARGNGQDAAALEDLPPIDEVSLGSLDYAGFRAAGSEVPRDLSAAVPHDGVLDLRGWCGDPETFAPCAEIFVAVDDRARIDEPGALGGDRPDVAAHFNRPALRKSGFGILLPAARVGAGTHSLRLLAVAHDRRGYFLLAGPVDVTVR